MFRQELKRLVMSCLVCLGVVSTGLLLLSPGLQADNNNARLLQEKAIARIERYIDYFRRTSDQQALRNELVQAGTELEQSIKLFKLSGAQKEEAYSLLKLGDSRRYLKDWDSAILSYQQAARKARNTGSYTVACKALLGHARSLLYSKQSTGSVMELVRQALPLAQQSNEPANIFDVWDMLAQVQITQGDYAGAADSMNRAFAVKAAVKDDKLLFYGYLDRADVYQQFAEKCDYERDFEPCLDALELARRDYSSAYEVASRLGWRGLAEQTQGFIQRLEIRRQLILAQQRMHLLVLRSQLFAPLKAGDVAVSQQFTTGKNPHLSGLLAWLESQGGLPPLTDARGAYIKGLLSEAAGQGDAALKWYLRAVELLEKDRSFLYDERTRGTFVEDKVEFYYTAILNLLDRHRIRDAFELMERSRSRVMSDLLATKNIALSSLNERLLYANMLQLRGEIAQLQACLFSARNAKKVTADCRSLPVDVTNNKTVSRGAALVDAVDTQAGINISALQTLLEQRQKNYQTILGRMAEDTPKLAHLLISEPVKLKTLQKTLARDKSEMIAYLSLESQLLIWHIGPDSIQVRSVFLPRSVLQDKIERVRKSLVDPKRAYDEKTAYELYLYLISPVVQWIKSDHLVIVAHEDLHYLPFQALPIAPGADYLGEKYQLSYAPGATVLASLAPAGKLLNPRLLAIADPSLQYAPTEVAAIGQRYSGPVIKDALPMEADVRKWTAGKELLHLAVHGRFTGTEPLLSYLYFQAGQGDDGKLTAAEMYGLPLDDARLVVLSACETGNVRATHANEVIGMMRGLLFAGADSLLLSAWKIDDQATAQWMQAFYDAAEQQPPAAAARAAIRTLRTNAHYRHPYYWSPFLLISR